MCSNIRVMATAGISTVVEPARFIDGRGPAADAGSHTEERDVSSSGWVLDVGALGAFAEGVVYAECVLTLARERGHTLLVPMPAVLAAYERRPADVAGPRLARLLADPVVVAADYATGALPEHLDRLIDRARGDRVAALVVHLAQTRGWPVLTDRGDVLVRLWPGLLIVPA